jgi:hypothetical protein
MIFVNSFRGCLPFVLVHAPCAVASNQEGDSVHFVVWIMVLIARVVFPRLYMAARSIEKVFVEEGQGVEWTVIRVGHLWW